MNKLSGEEKVRIVPYLAEGNSLRALALLFLHSKFARIQDALRGAYDGSGNFEPCFEAWKK